jgi:hypothetical protein
MNTSVDIRTSHVQELQEAGVAQNQFLSTVVPVKSLGDPAMAADAVFFLVSKLLCVAVLYNDVFEAFMQWRSLQRAYKPLMWGRLYEEYLLSPFVKPENPTYANIWHDFTTVGLVQTTHGWQIPLGSKIWKT